MILPNSKKITPKPHKPNKTIPTSSNQSERRNVTMAHNEVKEVKLLSLAKSTTYFSCNELSSIKAAAFVSKEIALYR